MPVCSGRLNPPALLCFYVAERGRGGAAGLRAGAAPAARCGDGLAHPGGGVALGRGRAAVAAEAHSGGRGGRPQSLLPRHLGDHEVPPRRTAWQRPGAVAEVPKFSDAFQKEWLADEASAFSVARRVLFDYKPCEPEMWLYLAAKTFPPCRYSGTMEELRAPWPGMSEEAVPKIVKLYQESAWRREDMSLLEFARKTNKKGEIAQWVWNKRNRQCSSETLEDFANNCKMEGEKLIAVDSVSVFNDRHYFGQWLALRAPFRNLEDLVDPSVAEKVPEQYQHLGNALARHPEHWSDEEAVAKELELEATGVAKVKSFLAKLKAERHLVEQYLAGHIVKGDAEGARRSLAEAGFPVPDEGLQLNRQQQLLRDSVLGAAERAAKARAAQDIEELDEIREAAAKDARPIAGLGPPGTGKTTAGNCVDRILESGGRALYALPTAQQAARVRSRHPAADVDTCAAAFWLWKERADEHLDALAQYDLVVVDEVSQLTAEHFDRVIQMWEAADKLPALVFTGDFWQLPGVGESQAMDSPKWRSTFVVNLHEMWRCKDEKLRKKLELLRTAIPTPEQLKDICRGHKAWTHAGDPTLEEIEQVLRQHHLHSAEGGRRQPALCPGAVREDAQAGPGRAGARLGGEPRELRGQWQAQGGHPKAAATRDLRGDAPTLDPQPQQAARLRERDGGHCPQLGRRVGLPESDHGHGKRPCPVSLDRRIGGRRQRHMLPGPPGIREHDWTTSTWLADGWIHHPHMVRKGWLVGRACSEKGGQSNLPLKVQQSQVPRAPILGRERGVLQGQAEGDALNGILCSAQRAPHDQVIHEVEQLVLFRVASNWPKNLLQEGSPDALSALPLAAPVWFVALAVLQASGLLLRAAVSLLLIARRQTCALSALAALVAQPDCRLAVRRVPVQVGPQGALQPSLLEKTERQLAPALLNMWMGQQEEAMLLEEVRIGGRAVILQKKAESAPSPLALPPSFQRRNLVLNIFC